MISRTTLAYSPCPARAGTRLRDTRGRTHDSLFDPKRLLPLRRVLSHGTPL